MAHILTEEGLDVNVNLAVWEINNVARVEKG